MKTRGLARALAVTGLLLAGQSRAFAGVEDWEVSEMYRGEGTAVRFVELVNLAGGCLFPTSVVDLFDGQGVLLDTISLSVSTACHAAPTYILLASAEAVQVFGVGRDRALNHELPSSGQLCFRSSATYYDCARWGTVNQPVVDLFGPQDVSSAQAPALGRSLARQQTTHVVLDDFAEGDPTPRQPNDGSTWDIPDAGVVPDAAPMADAGPRPDAGRRTDAAPRVTLDAGSTRYLDLDTVGGASCGCQSGSQTGASTVLLVLLALVSRRRRSELS